MQHRARTLKRVAESARSPSHNVRRLASEGIRPPAVGPHPRHPRPGLGAGLDIRGPLRSDPSEHVRKSVANNLDDIAGDHPGAVLATALRRLEKSPTPETGWTAKHGLRTLVKKGDRQAPALLGASGGEHVEVSRLPVTRAVAVGETVVIDLVDTDERSHRVTADHVVHHVRRNGRGAPRSSS
ncbi:MULTISPECIES: hypothetical protein [Streptomyces]|uniref:Uncharacterized protein n=1 Tax=Streptomyces diastaticus subsp. diastaticus TaxID=68040 RepID=A0ABQ1CQK1_STRDI|nr:MULTISPECIES: hypothetical protein [Streptomyces]GFH72410.1 hypothetical protein Sdia_31780 [Streptomyces diastaticus subsp. diastaticus]GGU46487.1 hypothetical protein GCM10015534_56240 [Streptomyces diastaticus subsp. diastaticus]